ncbi:hypothetical protein Tco_0085960 [Tanacetum coccineum]
MAALKFAKTHNLVVFLPKLEATANSKTVNGVRQLQALVDRNKVIVIESSIRRDLHIEDVKGKGTKVPQPSDSTKPIADEAPNDENVTTHSNDPLLSDSEIAELKRKVKKLEKKKRSRSPVLKRLRKVGRTTRIGSSEDEGLGDQENASKQGRKITDIDVDEEVTLIDETQERNDDNLMFDTGVLDEQEVEVEKVVSTAEVTTASATTTTVDELTLAQTLIEIKVAKPKAITIAGTTTTTTVTRPKARGVIVQELSEFTKTTSPSQPSQL